MTIAAILSGRTDRTVTINAQQNISEAARMLTEHRIGAMPVMDGEKVVGIVSERDIVHALAARGCEEMDGPVQDIMTSPPITVARDLPAMQALALMTRRRIRHLPVVVGETLEGFVSIGDLVKYRIDKIDAEAQAMREYIRSA